MNGKKNLTFLKLYVIMIIGVLRKGFKNNSYFKKKYGLSGFLKSIPYAFSLTHLPLKPFIIFKEVC